MYARLGLQGFHTMDCFQLLHLTQTFLKLEVQFIMQVFTFKFVNLKFQIPRILE